MPETKAVPERFPTLTPHLTVKNADKALDFYQKALGAQVLHVSRIPDGRVMHASLRIGDSMLMLNDDFPEFGSSTAGQSSNVTIHVNVDNVDDVFRKALDAGATEKMPVADQFWGDRYGQIVDPFGIRWSLGQHVRDVSPEELDKAMKEMFGKMPQKKTA